MEATLYLEDGSIFHGKAIGNKRSIQGEVVFTTAMTGYQETLTDPSYCNQIVTFTYPLIGNYGINKFDMESFKPHLSGVIAREICQTPSNYRSKVSFDDYLKDNKITGISGIDTRKLTRLIRNNGTMQGKIVCGFDVGNKAQSDYKKEILAQKDKIVREKWVYQVTTSSPYVIPGNRNKIVIIDLGCKKSLIGFLTDNDISIIVLPANTKTKEILSYNPQGVIFSNGPGDPKSIPEVIECARNLIYNEIPVFGVCLGHQVIGHALGFNSYKMKFGHRGTNHPVKNLFTGKVSVTSQNHGYTLDDSVVPKNVEITHVNVNDGTIEGLKHSNLPIFSIQFHPEANPGPRDNENLLQDFLFMLNNKNN